MVVLFVWRGAKMCETGKGDGIISGFFASICHVFDRIANML